MRLSLIFPPPADPAIPPAGIASLSASLQKAGIKDVTVRDLNVEAFDTLLRRSFLKAEADLCRNDLLAAQVANKTRLRRALACAPEVIRNIDAALSSLRDPEAFYNPPQLIFAKRIIKLACELLSARFPAHSFGKYSYLTTETEFSGFEQICRLVDLPGPLTDYLVRIAAPRLALEQPDIVGVSVCYSAQLIPAFVLADALKRLCPKVHIIMGGPIVTWGKHLLASDPRFSRWLDSFCLGEGEEILPFWIDVLAGRRSILKVKNIVYYSNGNWISTTDPTYRLSLDTLATPDFTRFPLKEYFAPEPIFCLTPARGCYYNKCSFCNYAFIKLANYRVRDRALLTADVERIIEQVGKGTFCFETDVLHRTHLQQLATALRRRALGIRWHAVAKIDPEMTPAFFRDLAAAGCVRLFVGIESGNNRILDLMEKGTSVSDAQRFLSMCQEAGISIEAGIIAGFPGETLSELEDTYHFILKNRDALARVDVGEFRLLRGSPLAEHPALINLDVNVKNRPSWHTINFENRSGIDAFRSLASRVDDLFPESGLIDVSEDILYHAAGFQHRWLEWRSAIKAALQERSLAASPLEASVLQ